ncbi:MAG TPA: cytochrome c oxidase assembly protein [Pseudonocardiaceae bacterium]|nr:cytochrome c oxidase assembly protein [Pseudonocardiaceae bacterium]
MHELADAPQAVAVYHGPPPLTLLTALTQWQPDIPAILFVALLGTGYYLAVHRLTARGGSWARGRKVAFGTGLGLILFFSVSFFGAYADTLFWARAAQVITLIMLAPLCLAMGSPVALALETLSERGADRVRKVLAGKPARVLSFPASGSVLLIATPWLFYFTGWYPAVLSNGVIDAVSRLALLTVGFIYFYSRLQLDPVPHKYPHLISIVITFVEVVFDAALGLVLWLSPHIVAHEYYQALGRNWGLSLRDDQIIGAGILWIAGDAAGLPFLGALMRRMSVDDDKEAAEIDRELDSAAAAAAAEEPEDEAPAKTGLWWENDPILAERFRRD